MLMQAASIESAGDRLYTSNTAEKCISHDKLYIVLYIRHNYISSFSVGHTSTVLLRLYYYHVQIETYNRQNILPLYPFSCKIIATKVGN